MSNSAEDSDLWYVCRGRRGEGGECAVDAAEPIGSEKGGMVVSGLSPVDPGKASYSRCARDIR